MKVFGTNNNLYTNDGLDSDLHLEMVMHPDGNGNTVTWLDENHAIKLVDHLRFMFELGNGAALPDDEYKKMSDKLTAAYVEIGQRDSMINHLQADYKKASEKAGLLHEKIGRMGAVNDKLLDALADLLEKGPIHTYVEAATRALDMALAERDNNFGE